MSTRLQIIVPEALERRIRRAAQRDRLSTSAWVRQAVERAPAEERPAADPLARLAQLGAPTADIGQMLAEIDAVRS